MSIVCESRLSKMSSVLDLGRGDYSRRVMRDGVSVRGASVMCCDFVKRLFELPSNFPPLNARLLIEDTHSLDSIAIHAFKSAGNIYWALASERLLWSLPEHSTYPAIGLWLEDVEAFNDTTSIKRICLWISVFACNHAGEHAYKLTPKPGVVRYTQEKTDA